MKVSKEELDNFCNALDNLEEAKKGIADDIKSAIETFAEATDYDKKAVKKFYKEWKEYQKNKDDYTQVDYEVDNLFVTACPEFATGS